MSRAFLPAAAALLVASGSAALAAPFDCTRALQGSESVRVEYSASRVDRIADFYVEYEGGPTAACPDRGFASITGQVDTVSGEGLATLINPGRSETYGVTLRGDLGTVFFDDPAFVGQDLGFIGPEPPLYRLDFRPETGRDLSFAFPNGFSVASQECFPGPGECGPYFLVFFGFVDGDYRPDFIASDGGGPAVIGAVPVPAALPLAATALLALGGLGWRRRDRAA